MEEQGKKHISAGATAIIGLALFVVGALLDGDTLAIRTVSGLLLWSGIIFLIVAVVQKIKK